MKPGSISVQTAPDSVKELHTAMLKAHIKLEMAIASGGCGRPAVQVTLLMSTTAASGTIIVSIPALSTTVRSPFAPLCG